MVDVIEVSLAEDELESGAEFPMLGIFFGGSILTLFR